MDSDQYLGWLALALTPGLGPRLAGKLLTEFGTPEAVSAASLTALEAQHLPASVAQAQAAGVRLLTWDEPEYPGRLREICDPPPLL